MTARWGQGWFVDYWVWIVVEHTRGRVVHQDVSTCLRRYGYTILRALSSITYIVVVLPVTLLTLTLHLLARCHTTWNIVDIALIIQTVVGPLVEVQTLLIHGNVGSLGRWVLVKGLEFAIVLLHHAVYLLQRDRSVWCLLTTTGLLSSVHSSGLRNEC